MYKSFVNVSEQRKLQILETWISKDVAVHQVLSWSAGRAVSAWSGIMLGSGGHWRSLVEKLLDSQHAGHE